MAAASGPLRIGISACFFHADPERKIFKGKTLQYAEQSIVHWVMSEGVLAYVIPSHPDGPVSPARYAEDLDALVLEGGSDLSPTSYRENPIRPEWGGDKIRDLYETALFNEFVAARKPVLGVCRGLQLINVALGGTLYQDIQFQLPDARVHRDWNVYDQLFHPIVIEPTSLLARLAGVRTGKVNSVHHQAVKSLGRDLVVEAKSETDGIVEAVRRKGDGWVYAVQWHPEFQDKNDLTLFDTRPLLKEFLQEARKRKN